MAINWNRLIREGTRLGRRYGPKVAGEVRRQIENRTAGRGPETGSDTGDGALGAGGRPVTRSEVPTSSRARRIVYDPHLDGNADPGEIVWTWVEYEERDGRGKDRPVLVVGRDRSTLLGLMMSSQTPEPHETNWTSVGSGTWDSSGRESFVRLDRVLEVPEEGIRREGAVCPQHTFDRVADRLRADHGWS